MKRIFLSTLALSVFFLQLSAQVVTYDAKFNLTICTKARNASAVLNIVNGTGNTFTGTLDVDTYHRSVFGWYIQTLCEGGAYNLSTEGVTFYVDLDTDFQHQQLFKGTFNFDKTILVGSYFYFGNEFAFYGNKVVATNSIETQIIKKEVKVYPNPVDNFLYIEKEFAKYKSIEIYELSGKLMISKKYYNPVDVSDLIAGSFILKLIEDESNFDSVKFTKR